MFHTVFVTIFLTSFNLLNTFFVHTAKCKNIVSEFNTIVSLVFVEMNGSEETSELLNKSFRIYALDIFLVLFFSENFLVASILVYLPTVDQLWSDMVFLSAVTTRSRGPCV